MGLTSDHAGCWLKARQMATDEVAIIFAVHADTDEYREKKYNLWLKISLREYSKLTGDNDVDKIEQLEEASRIMAAGMVARPPEWIVTGEPEHEELVVIKVENGLGGTSYITGYWDSFVNSVKNHGYLADHIKGYITLPADES